MGLRDDILDADDLRREPVEVPEWGLEDGLYVQELPALNMQEWATEMEEFQEKLQSGTADVDWRARLLVETLVDEDGERVFEDGDMADLSRKANSVIDRLADQAMRVNGFEPDEMIEAVEGN